MYVGYITVQQSSRIVVLILSVINHQLAQRLTRHVDACCMRQLQLIQRLSFEIHPTVIGGVVCMLSVLILASSLLYYHTVNSINQLQEKLTSSR